MTAPLIDFRGKITAETDAVIEAESRATGRDRSEIVREWLHDRAVARIHEASLLDQLLRAKGEPGIGGGVAGNRGDSRGRRRG